MSGARQRGRRQRGPSERDLLVESATDVRFTDAQWLEIVQSAPVLRLTVGAFGVLGGAE